MGCGAKRRAQRGVFHAHPFGLRPLRAQRPVFARTIHNGAGFLWAGVNVQTDTGNIAFRVTAVGLLAALQNSQVRGCSGTRAGRVERPHSSERFREEAGVATTL